jgi:hypothetical protein
MGDGSQCLRALELANSVRVARAALKRRVGAGQVGAGDVLLSAPREAASMSMEDLLCSQRGWGGRRTHVFLVQFGISESKTIGSLTDRQRSLLAAGLSLAAPPRFNQELRAGDPGGSGPPERGHANARAREPAPYR